jgi:hypothetical protein
MRRQPALRRRAACALLACAAFALLSVRAPVISGKEAVASRPLRVPPAAGRVRLRMFLAGSRQYPPAGKARGPRSARRTLTHRRAGSRQRPGSLRAGRRAGAAGGGGGAPGRAHHRPAGRRRRRRRWGAGAGTQLVGCRWQRRGAGAAAAGRQAAGAVRPAAPGRVRRHAGRLVQTVRQAGRRRRRAVPGSQAARQAVRQRLQRRGQLQLRPGRVRLPGRWAARGWRLERRWQGGAAGRQA